MAYEVLNTDTEQSHGVFRSLSEARGCVAYDDLTEWVIYGPMGRVASSEDMDFDPENIYNTPSIAQSIAEDRARRR